MATLLPNFFRNSGTPASRRAAGSSPVNNRFRFKFLATLLALFLSVTAYASHYKGGQITYQHLGSGTYKITVKSYWRSQLPGSVIPTYSGSPQLNTSLTAVSLTPLPDGVTVEKVEEQIVTWSQPGFYTISWTSCCRVSNGANFGQTDMGLFAAVNYDPANPSSSPQFYDLPVFNYAANVPLSFGFNNSDPENHQQVYSLDVPYGLTTNPYTAMVATGFSVSGNGIVNWTNPQPGIWLVNVKLEEKINGVLTGAYVYRDFMLNILPTTNHAPVMAPVAGHTVLEGTPLQFTVNATEPDGNYAVLRASGLPMSMGATFVQNTTGSNPTGTFSWTPPAGSAGTYSLQFVATDNVNPPLSTQITVPVTVLSAACNLTMSAAVTKAPCGPNTDGVLTVTATGGNGNYMYSIDNGQTFQSSNVFTNVGTGAYQVVAKDANCTTAAQTVAVIANPIPVVTLDAFNTVCQTGAAFALTGGLPAGGVYSGNGVTNGVFNPAVAGAGTHQISYTYTSAAGCENSATASITVGALPTVSFAAIANVCGNAAPFTLTQGSPAGGTYAGPGVINGVFWATVAGPGTHVLTYTFAANGCTVTATRNVTVNTQLKANAGPDKQVYKGYLPLACVTLNGTATGGSGNYSYRWNTGATTATMQVCPAVTTTYTLTVTDAAGCVTTDQVTVNAVNVTCGNKNDKVLVCHNGHEICIAANAVPAHLAHGCSLGSCSSKTSKGSVPRFAAATLQAVPNPFTEVTSLDFTLSADGNFTLEIYDLKGMLIGNAVSGQAKANERRSVEVNGSQWAKGVYMARLVTPTEVLTTRLMVVK